MRSGKRFSVESLQIVTHKNNLPISRFAFVVSTKIDKRATARNRMKRLLRESVHHVFPYISTGWDATFFVRKNFLEQSQIQTEAVVRELLKTAQILS